ncbi:MAG: hypothetical protein IV100_00290 [Myxococcales bacterium]|nr:hypothetical protein [Myxococcales bacterium]
MMDVGQCALGGTVRVSRFVMMVAAVIIGGTEVARGQTDYQPGALIIPMDTTYQDVGMLRAFGLVYALLRADVPVDWVISPGKVLGEADFVASATDLATVAPVVAHGYRGGPFVVKAADAGAAEPIVLAWQKTHVTTVHVATAPFVGKVRRALVTAPSIAVFADGNEDIAFSYLNAAAIPDSTGKAWPTKKLDSYAAWRDVMTVPQVAGETSTDHADGSLFDDAGNPLYCQLMTMHWGVKDAVDEVVAEMRSFLNHPTHVFAECQAVNAIENNPHGRFLTPKGYVIEGSPSKVEHHHVDYAFAQMDGTFGVVGGSEPSYSLPAGDAYYVDDVVMITEAGTPIGKRDVWMTGYIDGACPMSSTVVVLGSESEAPGDGELPPGSGAPPPTEPCTSTKGKVSYLAGHKYTVSLPMSQNPKSQGTRLFLNSLFEADCAVAEGQPNVSLQLSGPASTLVPEVAFTVNAVNFGPFPLLVAEASIALPAGVTVTTASGGGFYEPATHSVRWLLGNMAVGAGVTLTASVVLPSPGSYEHAASLSYVLGVNTKVVTSTPVVTLFDADSDGDGCPDAAELAAGTLPGESDTDGDLISDCDDVCPTLPNPLQDLSSDPDHCGGCGVACLLSNAGPACENEDCVIAACDDGWLDCDGTPATGCEVSETELATDPENCGGCGVGCLGEHGEGQCVTGTCVLDCDDGFVNLDGTTSNGCECELSSESEVACDDGLDDDCDGDVDGADTDCAGSADSGDAQPGDVDEVDAGPAADVTSLDDVSGTESDVVNPTDLAETTVDTGSADGGVSPDVASTPDAVASDVDTASDSTDQPRRSDGGAVDGDSSAVDGTSGGSDVAPGADVDGRRADVTDGDGVGNDASGDPSADQTSAGAIRGGGGCASVSAPEGTLGAAAVAGLTLLLGAALGRKRRREHAYVRGVAGNPGDRAH